MTSAGEARDERPAVAEPPPVVGAVPAEQVQTRVDGLRAAVESGRGRIDAERLDAAYEAAERARDRLRLSASHTVVALAGATGSGKSSLFNWLTGLELAAVGVKRPTTSWATACAWDPTGAAGLLDWLGVPARHQVSRLSMLDASPEDTELRGLVLLDLPDHDSTEMSHHLEVDRLVRHADLLVWVLDPQKYADAALHERYLRPHSTHGHVMLAVLNQVDRLTDSQRADTVADVRRLLAADGLAEVSVLATSTVRGDGLPELRRVLVDRIHAKQAALARVAADVAAAASRLADQGGAEAAAGSDDGVRAVARERLVAAVVVAAGLDTRATSSAGSAARRAAGWPPFAMLVPERPADDDGVVGSRGVDESLVEAALDDYVEQVGAGAASPWLESMRSATSERRPGLVEKVTSASQGAAAATAPPLWARLLGLLQVLLVLAALGAVGWQLAGTPRELAGWPGGWVAAVTAGGLALLFAPAGGALAAHAARSRVERDARVTRGRVGDAVDQWAVEPVDTELSAHAAWRRGLATARSI